MNFPKLFASFLYAWKGIILLIRSEQNAWVHLLATLLVIVFGCYFNISNGEWIAAILCIVLVLSAEGFNTALEKLTDLISPDTHPLAGQVKDLAAGAVLITAIGAFIVGLIIFLPYFLKFFQ
ncbi:MAG: diacylglycerol kinase family protein [Saprospiraceae bacterium]|nr:diacylglycerol kinase family protein [Saprospiraceae bacterium]